MRAVFEMYNGILKRWEPFRVPFVALLYDRDEAEMLSLCNGNNWEHYNPIRNLQVEG